MTQRDYVAMQARFNGWRYRDPGDVSWARLYERYRKDDRSVLVRYDNRGAIRSAALIESGYPRAEINRTDRRKDYRVSQWFAVGASTGTSFGRIRPLPVPDVPPNTYPS